MKCMDKHGFEQQNVFGTGAANTAYAKFFIGQSFLNPLTDPKIRFISQTLHRAFPHVLLCKPV